MKIVRFQALDPAQPPTLPHDLTQETVANFLRSCPILLAGRTRVPNKFEKNGPHIVVAYYTDGEWSWSAEVTRYFEDGYICLPEEFLIHIRELLGIPPTLTPTQLESALASFLQLSSSTALG